ncbi:hypothetical protein [Sandaracinus amylolyticus]|uniref:hypothetical protein n=1 Tax=Sandaracinus amylolyticus TaxID=927083 RepID=UPI001F2E8A35|nr:hypothetical protein [Sandaracinus amylolyticus]UJR84721.1 Hypothetical protein I5071_68000 [Sandaracinus amylolyticus]
MRIACWGIVVLVGCGGGPATRDDAAPPVARSEPFVVDGLVLWNEPIDRAPDAVREMWSFIDAVIAASDDAPRAATPEGAWLTDVYLPYWAEVRARIEPRGHALVATRERAFAELPAYGLFETLTSLVATEHEIRALDEAGFEPVVGGCGNGPWGTLGDLLDDCREHAERCVRLAAEATGAMRENVEPCARRAAICRARHAAAEQDVCEVDYPE